MQPGVDAFLVFQSKILLVQRENLPNISYPNFWNLPGGGIDETETAQQAIIRELKEEVNLESLPLISLGQDSYKDGNLVTKYFAQLTEEQKNSVQILEEGQAFGFFTIDEIMQMEIIPNLRTYIELNRLKLEKLLSGIKEKF